MKKKIIALISGAVILIIAAGSIYGKSVVRHIKLGLILQIKTDRLNCLTMV